MKSRLKSRYMLFYAAMIAAACVATIYFWPQLPERVPVHWNIHGVADGYGPREVLWLLGPGLMAAMVLTAMLLPRISPKSFGMTGFESTYYYLFGVIVCMLGYVYALVLAATLRGGVPMERAIPAAVFILLILTGNPMGKVRRNFFMGIRTPWTLASERVWYATHRLAAQLMVASGVLGLFALWLGAALWVQVALMLAWTPLAVGYSLLLYKRLPR